MRIDQNSYLSQITFDPQIKRSGGRNQGQAVQATKGADTVKISKEAREAYESYALNARKKNDLPDAKEDFRSYLKRCREEDKTPEDRLKELQEKLREVQEKISETADQAGLTDPSRQTFEEATGSGRPDSPEQDILSLTQKSANPSGLAKLESLYIQMDQIIEEIQKVAEEM